MKSFLTFLFSVIIINYSFSQRSCVSQDKLNIYLSKNINTKLERDKIENKIVKDKSNYNKQSMIIPVVFHVVYNNSTQNISDDQILSQLNVMNEDFNRTNSDAFNVPNDFDSIVTSIQISFCLAQQTPDGNPTNGIIRINTNHSDFQLYDTSIHYTNLGGSDAWNTKKYLNIWVGNISDGILGWAQFPGGGSDFTDGVVIDYQHFGTIGTASPPYNKGRTTTHELGHYFNLFHLWGDNNCGDDYVNDTPTQQGASFGCKTHPSISCNNNGDMFMNFMDYTDDVCMNSFTIGQRNRVWSSISNFRNSLIGSPGCNPVISSTSDADIEIIFPIGILEGCNNPVYPKILIRNKSPEKLYTALIKYSINSSSNHYQLWNGDLSQEECDTVLLNGIAIGGTNHLLKTSIVSTNNQIDIDSSNNYDNKLFQTTGGTSININLITDNYADETTWYLFDSDNNLLDYGDNLEDNQHYIYNYCLEDQCYKLVINDSEGDGFCCNYGNGFLSINKTLNNQEMTQLSYFNYTDTILFCISALNNTDLIINKSKIYPSPTSGIIYFKSDYLNTDLPILAKVFDLEGRLIFCGDVEGNSIDLTLLHNGIYILNLNQENKITNNKIIINKP
ncbi:MAG: hypothetical protein CMD22_05830 [Flavobacteriales bacterium]|nr:hypothetical protein [Flavobacteriales bacterium]